MRKVSLSVYDNLDGRYVFDLRFQGQSKPKIDDIEGQTYYKSSKSALRAGQTVARQLNLQITETMVDFKKVA